MALKFLKNVNELEQYTDSLLSRSPSDITDKRAWDKSLFESTYSLPWNLKNVYNQCCAQLENTKTNVPIFWFFYPVIFVNAPYYYLNVATVDSVQYGQQSNLNFYINEYGLGCVSPYTASINPWSLQAYINPYTPSFNRNVSVFNVPYGQTSHNGDLINRPTEGTILHATPDSTRDILVFYDMSRMTAAMVSDLNIFVNDTSFKNYGFKSLSWLQRAEPNVNKYSHFGLSMIKDNFINNGDYRTTTLTSDFAKLFSPSSIQNIIKGMNVGDEKVLSYVGNALADISLPQRTLTLTFDALDNETNAATVSLRFYVDRAEQSGLRQSYTYFKTAESSINYYIAFYIDEANEAARPTVIRSALGFYYYNDETITNQQLSDYYNWLSGGYLIDDPTIDDPFYWGQTSESSGGNTGTFDDNSDEITGAVTPNSNLIPSNFITIYTPSVNDMQNLSNALWDETAVAWLKRRWADPVEAIISLKFIPYAIGSAYKTSKSVTIGGHSTGLTFPMVTQQFFILHCGEIDLKGYYGSYLDYAPLTKVQLYLPYIDTVELDADVVMNHILRLSYNIDIVSGVCTAVLRVDGEVRYQFSGNLSYSIPLTSGDYSTYFTALIGGASKAISSVFLGAALGIPSMGATAGLSSAANAVSNSKATVSVSGSLGSTNGFMSLQTPYLIITTPTQCVAANQSKYMGYPLHTERKLSDLTGYTEIEEIHLENLSCTEGERSEIETLLKGGVIF